MKREHSIDAAAALGLLLLVVALYRKVARLFWTYDDAYLLHIATVRRWSEYLINGEVWRSMPQRLFTPLVTATYDSELSLFGLQPRAWYVVHLAMLALAVTAVYFAVRLWLPPLFAFCAAALVALGAPTANVATELMLVHYLEAIALGALSVIAFVRGVRRGRTSFASAVLYLLAMLAKEIAVPLVFLLVLLRRAARPHRSFAHAQDDNRGSGDARGPRGGRGLGGGGGLGGRPNVIPSVSEGSVWAGGAVVPHFAALAIYLLWRYAMLHTLIGGYGYTAPTARIIASLPAALLKAVAGPRLAVGVVLLIAIAVGIVAALRRNATLTIVAMLLAVAPIVPIAAHMQPRFAITAWIWACVAFAAGAATLPRRAAYALLSVALLSAIVVNRTAFRAEMETSKRMSDEARFFLDLGPGSLLRKPAIPPAALGELQWLKVDQLHRAAGAGWFYDDLFLCRGGAAWKRVWSYDKRVVREITSEVPAITARYCGSIRENAHLSAEFHYANGAVSWKLGPYEDGRYSLVIADGLQAFDVPAVDSFKIELPAIALRVRYQSPGGWVTYSPEIALDFVHHPDQRWTR
jgi:hypothetical protein